ncbi:MAG: hypothetical protein NUV54_01495 [Candidatus Taylorbacteria bacterium]|nr:hypothetical protein [Candidatus Taylorbacteria bacterium]
MKNNTQSIWMWSIVAVVVIVGIILISKKGADEVAPTDTSVAEEQQEVAVVPTEVAPVTKKAVTETTKTTTTITPKPSGTIVRYTDKGFEPAILEVKRGESVEFINESDKAMVIRSHDENPENFYPGFSQESGPLGKGGRFYFAFTLPGTWLYYNLNGNKEQGAIIVR